VVPAADVYEDFWLTVQPFDQFVRRPSHAAEGAPMDKIFDLPAHPLFAHYPIALAPVVVLAVIAMTVRPAWRASAGPLVIAGSVVVFVALLLARKSGEELYELLDREPSIGRHEDLANQSVLLWLGFVLVTVASVVLHRRARGGGPADEASLDGGRPAGASGSVRRAVTALAVLSIVLGVVSTVWIARTGHEGAKSHWSFLDEG
jgi:hypothetical protein